MNFEIFMVSLFKYMSKTSLIYQNFLSNIKSFIKNRHKNISQFRKNRKRIQ